MDLTVATKKAAKKKAKKRAKVTNTREKVIKTAHGLYPEATLVEILARITGGESLNRICMSEDMPSRKTFFEWVSADESIMGRYRMAMAMRADYHAEQIIEIADDGTNDTYKDEQGNVKVDTDVLGRSRLRVDARKWVASKLLPKVYGDIINATLSGPDGGTIKYERIERVIVDPKK